MAAPVDTGTPSVLLVDDRPENLLALEAVLGPLDVRLVSVTSGADALRALLTEDFAVILLDVQMPDMDGFETAERIQQRERSRRIPIIFLTAVSTDVAQIFQGYEAGAVDYLLKPFDPLVLRSKVSVFCDLDRLRRASVHSDELLRNAFEAAPWAKALADESGEILRVNPALCRLTGRDAETLMGANVDDLLHPADRADFTRARGELFAGRTELVQAEARVEHAEGRGVPVALAATPLRDAQGSVRQVLVNLQDITERRTAERAQAQLAVEQAARAQAEAAFARERAIAEALQKDLLPDTLPTVPGLAIAARFEAGGPETQIGGDWYDAIALPGGRLGLVVGDVAGRGVMAAARMGQLRSVARAYALEGHPPAVVAEQLNRYHLGLGEDQMTTLVYAIAEPDRGKLRYVNAGHPPPLLTLPGKAPVLLDGASPPLGADSGWNFEEREIDLPVGATLVLYTDGLVECRSEGIDKGLLRLRSAVIGDTDDVERICDRLHAAGAGGSGGDDVTTVVLRVQERLGSPARFTLGPDGEALGALRRALRRWLAEVGAQEEAEAVTMAANEAWQNAIEHGHGFSRAPIGVEFALDAGDVVITVRDTGHNRAAEPDPDRGRGIELMRALMDDVSLDLAGRGAVVTMRRRLAGAAAAPYASPSASYSRR